MTVIWHWSS